MKLPEQKIIVCPRCEGNKIKVTTNKSIAGSVALFSLVSMIFVITIPFAIMALFGSLIFLAVPHRSATCLDCKHTHNITKEQVEAFKNIGRV